ncbi:extended synaptotagmin-2-like [Haliotis asinina]|uniref:extended synaptotagmin-2-like n=1 Tax=Haliotis asinina TaxID=109174 RepID=UPI003531C77B
MSAPAEETEKPASPKRKSALDDTLLLNVVTEYFKLAGVVLVVWFVGYFAFSPSWLLLGLVVYVWKEKHTREQKLKIEINQRTARDEKTEILARVEDLPSWVCFPDVERAEWLNKMIDQLWPYIGDYVDRLLRESIEPKIRESLPASLSSFKFSKIDIGDIPPRIGGVKVYTQNVRRDEIYMDLEIVYSSDSNVAVQVKGINAGIKDLQIHGIMRVIFKPLISKMPLMGGISVFFLNNPTVDFNLTSLANAFDLPGLNDMLHTIVIEQIANIMVLPNRIPISMVEGLNLNKLRYPQPQGVLRIHLLEAKELVRADIGMMKKGKSDPYAIAVVGAQTFKTKTINNTICPQWNMTYEAIVDVAEGQCLQVDVLDDDPGSKDDPLGNASVDISHVFERGMVDEWLQLENVKSGFVHVRLQWLYLANDPLELDRMVQQVQEESKDDDSVSSCILLVNLDSARDLPRGKKTLSEPSPQVYLYVGQSKHKSGIKANTNEPRWEENFRFLIHNPNYQNLDVEVRDSKSDKVIGAVTIKLKELLSATDMVLDQKFPLKQNGPAGILNMRLALRVLTPNYNADWLDESEPLITEPPPKKEGEVKEGAGEAGGSPAEKKPEGTSVDKPSQPSQPAPATDEVIPPASSSVDVESSLRQRKAPPMQQIVQDPRGEFGNGRIQMTFRYSPQRQTLIIVVHKCVNLRPFDSDNLSDPYVRMYLLPEKSSSSRRKTQVIKDNLNPVFDETFEYPISPSELPNRSLEICVKNEVGVFSSSKKIMGVVNLELNNLDTSKAITEWFDLRPEDNTEKISLVESDV